MMSDKAKHMTEAANQLKDMIQERLNNRVETLASLNYTTMDNLPDEVKQHREEQQALLRAVMIEQRDIISIIKMLFPGA